MRWLLVPVLALSGLLTWAAFAPIDSGSRDALFEIPKGTWKQRMSGDRVGILPDTIRLTLGINDVLVLKNLDDVPQMFGPTLMMPGQSFRLPFAYAASYSFACTAHASGEMLVIVDPYPAGPWSRIVWRTRQLFDMPETSLQAVASATATTRPR
jgi:hypothetical protein